MIIFELTGDYRIILPLMAAVGLTTVLAGLMNGDSIYTLKLRRRGVDLTRDPPNPLRSLRVVDAMQPAHRRFRPTRICPPRRSTVEAVISPRCR